MTEKLERPREHGLVLTVPVIADQDCPIAIDSRVSNNTCELFDRQEFQRSPVKYSRGGKVYGSRNVTLKIPDRRSRISDD
jgi:hypothetical protein